MHAHCCSTLGSVQSSGRRYGHLVAGRGGASSLRLLATFVLDTTQHEAMA